MSLKLRDAMPRLPRTIYIGRLPFVYDGRMRQDPTTKSRLLCLASEQKGRRRANNVSSMLISIPLWITPLGRITGMRDHLSLAVATSFADHDIPPCMFKNVSSAINWQFSPVGDRGSMNGDAEK